jgi:DNA topoisomerase IA/ssDNA-binding Zn-finger/Zn-ribbon topoisomerase 1
MRTLIVTEKPNVAERIAKALGKAVQKSHGGIRYYEVGDTLVAPAVGHIFGLKEAKSNGWTYPVFDIMWAPSYEVNKSSDFTRKYLNNIKHLAKGCGKFINACDYDVEGEVIGYNVIKHACKADPEGDNVSRMKYSTLTRDAIVNAFEKAGRIDFGLAYAGLARHMLDWYWGINLSRALTNSARRGRGFTTLSIGRVQGPTLKILSDKERSIRAFKSEKYWEIEMFCLKDVDFSAMYEAGKLIFSLDETPDAKNVDGGLKLLNLIGEADSVSEIVKDDDEGDSWTVKTSGGVCWDLIRETDEGDDMLKIRRTGEDDETLLWIEPDSKNPTKLNIYTGHLKSGEEAERIRAACKDKASIIEVGSKRYRQNPPHPFDLTTLQTEAYRHFNIDPRRTLEIAQTLYTSAYISYPRTSSQQIPNEIDVKKILAQIGRQKKYSELCNTLAGEKELAPFNGKKTDPAHPAIHPTGEAPARLSDQDAKIYDLIVRRFLATMGEAAVRQSMTVRLENNNEPFIAKGNSTVEKGWHTYYGPYAKFEENTLPNLRKGDEVDVKDVKVYEKETKPPRRYTPASIIREMEKRNIGTKATRSQIVDILYKRGYVNGKSLEVSELGLSVVEALKKYCPDVLSEELTRKFESDMEDITHGKTEHERVLEEGRSALKGILEKFRENEANIGKALLESIYAQKRSENTVGKCPKCGEDLVIRSSNMGQFIGCSGYPECRHTWNLPNDSFTKAGECRECGYMMLSGKPKKGRKYLICANPECPSRKIKAKIEKIGGCPKCGAELVIRKSRYGTRFIGCTGYPNCRNLWPLPNEDFEEKGRCQECGYPRILVSPKKGGQYELCVNPGCKLKNRG